jgi:hypothetical protein
MNYNESLFKRANEFDGWAGKRGFRRKIFHNGAEGVANDNHE